MKITIAEPVLTNPLEQFKPIIAVRTRQLLAEMFPDTDTAAEEVQPLDKEVLKEMKQLVYTGCDNKMIALYSEHKSPEAHMLRAVGVAALVANFEENREGSYRVEFAFQWLRGYLFKNKLPMPTEFPANTLGALCYPECTCSHMDHYLICMGVVPSKLLSHLRDAVPSGLLALYEPPMRSYYGEDLYEGNGVQTEVYGMGDYRGVVYTEGGTAWFAGFLNADDVLKLRFRRMRLGAAVKEMTGDDALARRAADIRDLNAFDLVLHPNDRPFGAEYVRMCRDGSDLGSCMTDSADSYDAPFYVHPCDVYSCAYYGQGDNGLVLVEAQQSGIPVGRGILNVHTKQIVRWYGEYKAEVMLRNSFSIDMYCDALDDVQLALIQDDNKIAAPYLDGCSTCTIEDGELYIRGDGGIEMNGTFGYQYCEAHKLDVCSGDYYPESELEYQPIHETYYHPENTGMGVFCPITEEYCTVYDTKYVMVDGGETRVSDIIYYECISAPGSWEFLGGSVGWTENIDDYTYDDETEEWYTNEEYEQLVAEREEEQEEDKDEAA
ncbi:MAG: hypothetical protein [Caudoviricetes sp.]|nr:MAG: hypothetical protein [Caudoviricetes sp.]